MNVSNLLIKKGSGNKDNFSVALMGNLKDKDKDGYPKGFSFLVDDCNDKDFNKQDAPNMQQKINEVANRYGIDVTNQAIENINRVSQGKKEVLYHPKTGEFDSNIRKAMQDLETIPEIKTAVTQGYRARQEAKSLGFENTQEYVDVSKGMQKIMEREPSKLLKPVVQQPDSVTAPINEEKKMPDILTKPKLETQEDFKNYLIAQPTVKPYLKPTKEIVLPYQQRGTSFYLPEKGFYVEPAKVVQVGSPTAILPEAKKDIQRVADITTRKAAEFLVPTKIEYQQYKTSSPDILQKPELKSPEQFREYLGRDIFISPPERKPFYKVDKTNEFARRRAQDVARLGLYGVPGYGQALLAADVFDVGTEAATIVAYPVSKALGRPIAEPETLTYARENPKEFLIETGSSLAVFTIGGIGVGKYKAAKSQAKIKEAIKESKVQYKSEGYLQEGQARALKISPESKTEIIKLLDEGYSARKTKIRLVGENKELPKIEGNIVEVVNQRGDIIKRISVGEIKAEYKGKKVSEDVLAQSIFKIEESGKVKGYTEVIEKMRGNKADPTLSKFYESSELKSYKEDNKIRKFQSESKSDLISREPYGEKYKFEKTALGIEPKQQSFFSEFGSKSEVLPDFDYFQKRAKPYSKANTFEIQELKRTEGVKISKGDNMILGSKKYFDTKTIGEGQMIGVEEKIRKPSKSWKEQPTKEAKDIFYREQPKTTKEQPTSIQLLEEPRPSYTGGEGQTTSKYQEYFELVPASGDVYASSLGEKLPRALIKPSISLRTFGAYQPSVTTRTRTGITSGNIFVIDTGREKTKTKDITLSDNKLGLSGMSGVTNILDISTIQGITPKEDTTTRQDQRLKEEQIFKTPSPTRTPTTPTPFNFIFPEEVRTDLDLPRKQRIAKKDNQGFNAYALIESTKPYKKYYKKLNDKPLTQDTAISKVARFIDNNISARGKIERAKGTPVQESDNYFKIYNQKFRKGKGNTIIEKRKYRLDSAGEVKNIQTAKRFIL